MAPAEPPQAAPAQAVQQAVPSPVHPGGDSSAASGQVTIQVSGGEDDAIKAEAAITSSSASAAASAAAEALSPSVHVQQVPAPPPTAPPPPAQHSPVCVAVDVLVLVILLFLTAISIGYAVIEGKSPQVWEMWEGGR